jgi:GLPGLI family protein
MKKIYLIVSGCLFFVLAQAQRVITQTTTIDGGNVRTNTEIDTKQKEIAKGTMEFFYDYHYLSDTNNIESVSKDMMLLQVGNGLSKFSSYRAMQIDSLISASTADQIMANPQRYSGGETFSIYKNYPEGKCTTTDKIVRDWLMYEEDIPVQEWNINSDSVKEILGYKCRQAECDFRGRKYIAWYSDEIPIPDGPWKLGGLPGFIMEASDSQGHYIFTLVGINSNATRDITIPDVQFIKTTRDKYYNTKRKFEIDPLSYISGTITGMSNATKITVENADGSPVDPNIIRRRELKYEYIEKDYKH